MWATIDNKHFAGARVLDAETVRRLTRMDLWQHRLMKERADARRRLAMRLRKARERALRHGRSSGMGAVGRAFASDYMGWVRWLEQLKQAQSDAVERLGAALPKPLLLEKQICESVTVAARDTVPLKVHANAKTLAAVERMLAGLLWGAEPAAYMLVVTPYLADDACIIETPRGLVEGHADLEVAAFCRGLREVLGSVTDRVDVKP